MATKKKTNGNGGIKKPDLQRDVVDKVRMEFMLQASYQKFRPYIEASSFTDEEKLVFLELAKIERWDDEYISYSDAFRRKVDVQIANHLQKMSLANVRSGRRKMIAAADKMMNLSEAILQRALRTRLLDTKTNVPLSDDNPRTHGYLKQQLAFIKTYGGVVEQSQKIWAGALGLSDALQSSFPDEEFNEETIPMSDEMQAMMKEFNKMRDEYQASTSEKN